MRYIFKLFKPILLIVLVAIYGFSFKLIINIIIELIRNDFPFKIYLFSGLTIYLLFLIILFLIPLIFFEKSIINSIIWAGILNVFMFLLIGYLIFRFQDSNSIILDLDLNNQFRELNNSINFRGKTSENDYLFFKRTVSFYIYIISFLFFSNLIASVKLYRKINSNN